MTAIATLAAPRPTRAADVGLIGVVAWRNLWRNRRRTVLSIGAIAFAVTLLSFAMAQQSGNYAIMIDNATGLLSGHLQVQHRGFFDDPKIGDVLHAATQRVAAIRRIPAVVAATPRISAFVLASAHDHSVGAELLGVEPAGERAVSTLPNMVTEGRYLASASGLEAFAGELLARNLDARVGDELVVLGTTPTGGVAPLALTLVGTFASGVPDIDRSVVEVPFETAAAAFELDDSAHAIVVKTRSAAAAGAVAAAVRRDHGSDDAVVLEWPQLVAGLEQAIELDRIFGNILFATLAVIVTMGVFNAFVMTIFERTREFGTLLALGMRPRTLIATLQIEGLCLAALGCSLGLALAVPLIAWLAHVGIPLGEAGAALRQFHAADRMYPALDVGVLLRPVALMMVGTALASLLPALRIRSIRPVEAMRAV
ncbi:MAG TPA: FtsX-like permease family protein [Pseudomonadales bacterium]|nr:FtsX-like permease family protein [Pseudomonadales bacterium]